MTRFWSTFLLLLMWSLIDSTIESPVSIIAPRDDDPYRLPENLLQVHHYDIELTLYDTVFDTNTFEGHSIVSFSLLENTNSIKIHADGMNFSSVTLLDINDNSISLLNEEFAIDPVTTFVTINTVPTLQAGSIYYLHFHYVSLLRTDAFRGFYKSSYQTLTGETKNLATTQFQTTFARRAFPCFDEPSFKATFDIKIIHPNEYNAKSNTRGTEEEITRYQF